MRATRDANRALLGVLSACIVAAGVSAATAVWAADYPPSQHRGALSLPNGSTASVNGEVAIAGTDCGDTQAVTVAFDGTTMRTVTSDSSGAFSTSVAVPSGTQPGTHTVTASNDSCDLTANVTVTAASDPASGDPSGTLPKTGSSTTMPTTFLAIGAVLFGTALVVVTRRRLRRSPVTEKNA